MPGAAAAGGLRRGAEHGARRASRRSAAAASAAPISATTTRKRRHRRALSARGQHPARHDAAVAGARAGRLSRHLLSPSWSAGWWRTRDATPETPTPASAAPARVAGRKAPARRRAARRARWRQPRAARPASCWPLGCARRAASAGWLAEALAGRRAQPASIAADGAATSAPTPASRCATSRSRAAEHAARRPSSAALGVNAGKPILAVDPAGVTAAAREPAAGSRSATVERRLPDTLYVRITERPRRSRSGSTDGSFTPDRPRRRRRSATPTSPRFAELPLRGRRRTRPQHAADAAATCWRASPRSRRRVTRRRPGRRAALEPASRQRHRRQAAGGRRAAAPGAARRGSSASTSLLDARRRGRSICACRTGWWCGCRRTRASCAASRSARQDSLSGRSDGAIMRKARLSTGGGLIAALDIGTTKVCCFIARLGDDGRPRVVGIGHQLAARRARRHHRRHGGGRARRS